ncbi:MAG: DivIVA domain-containing protein [Acidimicrobiia bacterium]
MLTAADVEQKTFSTALRGYDLDEVDDFLDEIVATIRDLNDQLEEAKKSGAAAPTPVTAPAPVPEPEPEAEKPPVPETPAPVIDESAVGRALIAAQTAADQLLEDAKSEANKIVDDAKSEADTWEAEREAKRVEAEAEIASIANRVSSVKAELSVLAGEVAVKLDDMDAVIAGRHATSDMSGDGGDVLEFGSSDDEDGVDDDETETGGHLDDILNGVAADLQLDSEDSDDSEDSEDPADSDGPIDDYDSADPDDPDDEE